MRTTSYGLTRYVPDCGPRVPARAHAWSLRGQIVVFAWSDRGPGVVRSWSWRGQIVVLAWSDRGLGMVRYYQVNDGNAG